MEELVDSNKTVILSGARTPIGKLGGALSSIPAPELGSIAIKAAIGKAKLDATQIDYTIMGNVLSSGLGQAPARQAAISAGISNNKSALTVNKVCASGIMSIILATLMIRAGDADIVVAGGMENMSLSPHLLPNSRTGKRAGQWEMLDSMIHDGLWCCFNDTHMGSLAENTANKFKVTRKEQDEFALKSNQRAIKAIENGAFNDEIYPVTINTKKGSHQIYRDEGPREDSSLETLSKLSTAFPPYDSVTSGNSSQISDGAAAVIVTSEDIAKSAGLKVQATIEDYTYIANSPAEIFEAPSLAIQKLLDRSKMTLTDIGLLEINEAFAAQVVANTNSLKLDIDKVNINGGAVALGHPIGASGSRILVTLINSMQRTNLENGIATLCHGGGGAVGIRISID